MFGIFPTSDVAGLDLRSFHSGCKVHADFEAHARHHSNALFRLYKRMLIARVFTFQD